MRFRASYAIFICLAGLTPALGQTTETTAPARSHVERFSTPEVRAERAEFEATAKLTSHPNDAEALNARSLARMRLGRYKEAYEDLQRAVALKPDNADYQANLGYVLWKLGRAQEALNAERTALRLDEKNFTAHYQLGRFLLRVGDSKQLAEAVIHLRRAVEIDPRQYEPRFELIAAYRTLGETAQANTQLSLLQDARPSDPRIFYVNALLASDRGDLNEAIKGFRETLRRDPTLLAARQDLGLAYIKLGRWPEAVEVFAELTRLQADSVDAAYFYALALFNTNHDAEAEREVRRALRLNAGAAVAHTLLGIILASRGDADVEASEALNQAVALDPTSFDALYYLGRVLGNMKDFTGAVRNLREAVKLNPKHGFARFLLGTALESTGESEAALAEYNELVKIEPESAFGQMGLGALLSKKGKTDEAIVALGRAISLNPTIFEAHWAMGRALANAGRYTEAIESFQKAVALAPDRPDGHYQLGLTLRRVGRNDEAARELAIVARLTEEFRTRTIPNQ